MGNAPEQENKGDDKEEWPRYLNEPKSEVYRCTYKTGKDRIDTCRTNTDRIEYGSTSSS